MSQGGTGVSMNKELFVSSTPHETKVGLVEDDLLAEIYLERENEYTLAGSIYKGRVTRVLPGMQSAFVDVGLERDAFLYVSDFMELEEHDEDVTDIVPANRGVSDMRAQPARAESSTEVQSPGQSHGTEPQTGFENSSGRNFEETQGQPEIQSSEAAAAGPERSSGGSSTDRERGGYRGRRRRRGGRRDGRGDGRDRGSEPRLARPVNETDVPPTPAPPRPQESGRTQQFGPPRDTSRFCFPENPFRNTGGWHRRQPRGSGISITIEFKRRTPYPVQCPPNLQVRVSRTMNPSLRTRFQMSRHRLGEATIPAICRKAKPILTHRRRQLRWSGTVNFASLSRKKPTPPER